MKDRNMKSVPFNTEGEEKVLFDFAEKKCKLEGIKFATYVKRLIKKDMSEPSLDEKIKRTVEEYLKDKKLEVSQEKNDDEFTEQDTKDLQDFLKL